MPSGPGSAQILPIKFEVSGIQENVSPEIEKSVKVKIWQPKGWVRRLKKKFEL